VTPKPAFQRSRANACNASEGVATGASVRAALVSRTAPESAAVMVRERRTVSRAEPSSAAERARISPRMARVPSARSSVSTREHRVFPGREGSVGAGGILSMVCQESVAENSIRPAAHVAMVPAGSRVGSTGASGLAAWRRARDPPIRLSGPPLVGLSALLLAARRPHPGPHRRRGRSRRTAGVAARGGS
jgi:hypothetical protein